MVQNRLRKSRIRKTRRAEKPLTSLQEIFSEKRSKWLPLYRRLLARVSSISGIQIAPQGKVICITLATSQKTQTVAQVRVLV